MRNKRQNLTIRFFFFFSFPSSSDFGNQLPCILESERCDVLKHNLVLV